MRRNNNILTLEDLLKSGVSITLTPEQLKEAFMLWLAEYQKSLPAETPVKDKEYLDVKQAAEFLNTSISSIRRWSDAGNFPKRFRGRKIYFWKSDLVKYMSEAE